MVAHMERNSLVLFTVSYRTALAEGCLRARSRRIGRSRLNTMAAAARNARHRALTRISARPPHRGFTRLLALLSIALHGGNTLRLRVVDLDAIEIGLLLG